MKKVIVGLLTVALSFSIFTGCGNTGEESDASATAESVTENEGSEEAASGADAFANLPENWLDADVVATPEMYPNVDMSKPYTVNIYQEMCIRDSNNWVIMVRTSLFAE